MYIISKITYIFLNPTNWILVLLLFALFHKKRKQRWLKGCVIVYLFFSMAPIFQVFSRVWEIPMTDMRTIEQKYDIGIVLGGFSKGTLRPFDRLHLTSASTRLTTAIELYQEGVIKKIMVTGGSYIVPKGQKAEGERCRIFLEKLGIPKEDIIIENQSLDTHENAIFSKKIIEAQYPNSSCLLITSAWHMRRSRACFKKANLPCDTFSTDTFDTRLNLVANYYYFPNGATLLSWQYMIKEWFGFVVYKGLGYI